jgi:prepilin-type N-terminal cleavage/methylation domain-containing protein/prepilin-type processing-associated H-X9-DG protein
MFKRSQAPRGAFTLIEILVVIGIIALLAAILFPVFARVRENGRKTVCNSNMKQLGLAFQQYTQDSGGRYPFAGQLQFWANGAHWVTGGEGGTPKNYDGTTDPTGFGLANPTTFATIEGHEAYPEKGALFPYAKSTSIFICPSAKDSNKKKLSYSMNCAVAGMDVKRVRDTSEIILLVDEGDTVNDGYMWATNNSASTDGLFKGHNGGGNLLFVDGHAKFYSFDSMPIDKEAAGQEIKSRTTRGKVRFRDLAFGPKGANVIMALNPDPTKLTNSCSESAS